jgi:hypothetical protein
MRLHPVLQQPRSDQTCSNLRTCVADHDSVHAIRPLNLRSPTIPSPSLHWKRTWTFYYKLGNLKPRHVRGAAGRLGDDGLMITSTPEDRFVHWKGMKLSDLLEDEDQLVAHLEPLPFQEGKPLATTVEESTELVEVSSDELISRQVLMAEVEEDDGLSPNETLDMISEDEATANAGDENDTKREARRARNRARAARRRRVNERIRSMNRELDAEFTVVSERGFRTPVANIARVTAIFEHSNDPNLHQALRYV